MGTIAPASEQVIYPRLSTIRSLPLIPQTTNVSPVRLALSSLVRVLRNSILCITVGWLSSYCFTVGNVFSGLPPSQQSVAAFNSANMAWWYGVFSSCMVIIISAKLPREQFVTSSATQVSVEGPRWTAARKLSLIQCIRKLLPPTSPFLLFGAIAAIGGDFGLQSLMPVCWRELKPFLYIAAFWGFFSMVIVDVYARRIFQTETVRGLEAVLAKSKTSFRSYQIQHLSSRTRYWTPSFRRFLHVYHQNLPVVIFTMTSIVYVHVVSRFIRSTGQWGLIAFSTASIALKLLLQEVAKHVMIIVHRPVSRRVMVALVSTPTILVDTQVRILLLRQDNLKISLAGTALIAVFEVGVRATKSVIVQRQTCVPLQKSQRRFSSINPQTKLKQNTRIKSTQQVDVLGSTDSGQWISNTAVQSRLTSTGETPAEYKARRNEMERRQKIRVLHAGEIYADMYAEYIAIGCSFAILYFFRFHPQYDFSILVSGASDYFSRSTDAGSISRDRQLVYLGYLQMGVEVVVDFVACTLEATRGVELKSFDQNDPFLIFFMVMLTFSNIGISAGLYMH